MFPMFIKDPKFMYYFPDKYPKGKGPPREYFFNVLNTLQPEYLTELLAFANKQRMTGEGEARKNETIKISEFWAEELKAMPYLSRKCLLLLSFLFSKYSYRKARQDAASSEGQQQARAGG